ncbi:hypothetical protein GGR56DRAFT_639713 [Xylariaceae sp. FL0804]|nr:hypothetical protein GGR56DRAFT_639713 [Xylariaceae sp. FL0804]
MPRSGGGRSGGRAPARPTVSRAPAPTQQTRPATTMAAPAQQQHHQQAPAAPQQASQGPGLFGQMASTAAGVAVGSSIGHAIGGMFGGGSSAPAEQQQQASTQVQATPQQAYSAAQDNQFSNNCAGAAESFTKCMDDHSGNMQICNWYLEQLKACQQAAKQY